MSTHAGSPSDESTAQEGATEPGAKYPRWLVLAVLLTLTAALALIVTRSWWQDEPERPTMAPDTAPERPILGDDALLPEDDDPGDVAPPLEQALDLEQQAFLEAARADDQESEIKPTDDASTPNHGVEVLPDSDHGTNFTDQRLLEVLGDSVWRFETGRRSSLRAEFGTAVLDRIVQDALVIELYPLYIPNLSAPYYTPFTLPGRGTYLAFRARNGTYRLLLEDVEMHGTDRISYRLDGRRGRLNGRRLEGSPATSFEPPQSKDEAADPPGDDRPAAVEITFADPSPLDEMWQRAETLRTEDRLHTLKTHLDRLLSAHPGDARARRWRDDVDSWIRTQESSLARDVREALKNLTDAAEDRDTDAIDRLWGGRADAETRRYFEQLFERHPRVRAAARVLRIEVRDGVASFEAALTLEGRSGRLRDAEIEQRRWRGELRDGSFTTPFS